MTTKVSSSYIPKEDHDTGSHNKRRVMHSQDNTTSTSDAQPSRGATSGTPNDKNSRA